MRAENGASQQHDLEHRALVKVRGLVDRLDAMAAVENRRQRMIIIGIAVAVVVGVGGLGVFAAIATRNEARVQKQHACEMTWKADRIAAYQKDVREGRDPNPGVSMTFENWYKTLAEPATTACAGK
jgi:hypothetical protein